MEFYSDKKPNLIGFKIHKTVDKIVNTKPTNATISDKITEMVRNFYDEYINEHKLLTFLVLACLLFLLYRYYNRNTKEDDVKDLKEEFSDEEYNILKNITGQQTQHLRYDEQPTMNPLYPVHQQAEKVYYPPDPLPINIPGEGFVYSRNIYKDPDHYTPINAPNGYDYDNVYKNKSRSYYNGTYNTYKNAQNTNIINPLGYPVDFNTSTGDFVTGMTNRNEKVVTDYQAVLDNMNGNLTDSLKSGPYYLDTNFAEYSMEPPYATDIDL